jgi:acetyl esterase/lipase
VPIDPHAERFLQRLAALRTSSSSDQTVDERRSALEHLLEFAGRREPVERVGDERIPGPAGPLRIRIYTPSDVSSAAPGLLYLHGGGLLAGSVETHDSIARSLANASRCRLVALDYRLAPEHPFPAALDDAYAAACWIGAHGPALGIDPERLGICGDSAGATLAAVVCQRSAKRQDVRLAWQLLLCPILDYGAETPSRLSYREGYFLDAATLEHDLRNYLTPGVDRTDPRVSPLRASDLSGLPPTAIHTAEFDPLRDEGAAYAQRLRLEGVRTLYRCHSGMIHLFHGMGALIPYAAEAYRAMGADVRSLLKSERAAGEIIR